MSHYHLSQLDAVAWLQTLGDESVDLIVTDPAYESLEKHRAVGTTTRLTGAWFPIFRNDRFPELFRELYRVLRRDSHCYVICDQETMFVAKPMAEEAGFKFWKFLVWDKLKIGMGYHYRARHELVLFLEKGKRRLNNLGVPGRRGELASAPADAADLGLAALLLLLREGERNVE
jgi:site-specific DNA-methyltransferase (adenine-specific)